jgi:hypothetical protein
MTGIKLEIGKRYVRRDGKITGTVEFNQSPSSLNIFPFLNGNDGYTETGKFYLDGSLSYKDLVSEHVEPAPEAGVVGVPAGWKLVPIEPTAEIVAALVALTDDPEDVDGTLRHNYARHVYATALAAAPASPPSPSDPVVQKLVEALRAAERFIVIEYGSPRAQAEDGELLDRPARIVHKTICAALALVGEVG